MLPPCAPDWGILKANTPNKAIYVFFFYKQERPSQIPLRDLFPNPIPLRVLPPSCSL